MGTAAGLLIDELSSSGVATGFAVMAASPQERSSGGFVRHEEAKLS
jgi:hypothetical protein